MIVYLVWLDEKWMDPELCDIFDSEEGAERFRDELMSKRTKQMIDLQQISYYVLPHNVRTSGETTK